jgi:hypothetical protein
MKNTLFLCFLLIATSVSLAAPPPVPARRMKDLRGFPLVEARRMLPKDLYRSLEVSPVESWVVARALIYSSKPAQTTIIHEEGDGAYDPLIKAVANLYRSTGFDTTESRIEQDTLTFNLLIYAIKDGKMAVVIPRSDDARHEGYLQYGDAWIGVYKNGQWTQVSHPGDRRRWTR